ncbi:MAG: hypothetical protein ACRD6W_01380 [Nitrososphaerales archaeon]
MPTDEELQGAVEKATEKATKDAEAAAEKRIKEASNGKFTQEDLDRVAGEARADGRKSGEKELLKSIGVEDVETAKTALKTAKDAEDASKTESQKLQEENAKLKADTEAAQAEARATRVNTALALKIRDAGINPNRASAALKLVDASKLEVKGDEIVGLDEAVKELKAQSPEWFGAPGSIPDASGGGGNNAPDFRTGSADDRDKALAKYGIRL